MQALKILVVVMGILIVGGVVVLGVAMTQKLGGLAGAGDIVLAEPKGTVIAGIAASADRIAVHLRDGGPDRILLLDGKTGRPVTTVTLAK